MKGYVKADDEEQALDKLHEQLIGTEAEDYEVISIQEIPESSIPRALVEHISDLWQLQNAPSTTTFQ